jgi:hypothetical protein
MAEPSVFRSVLEFFTDIGIYDVILPFLLVFTIIFAILEKTKVLGTEDVEGKKFTKKNLNAMVAFVIGFLVVASAQLVRIINETMANIVLLLLVSVSFLLLIGSFYREDEPVALFGKWRTAFTWAMLVGLILIFAAAITVQTSNGEERFLFFAVSYLSQYWSTKWVASIILMILLIVFMVAIVKEGTPATAAHGKKGGE